VCVVAFALRRITPRLPTPPCSLARDLYARRTRTCCRTQHPLQPAALAFVSYGFVLVRVRVLSGGSKLEFEALLNSSKESKPVLDRLASSPAFGLVDCSSLTALLTEIEKLPLTGRYFWRAHQARPRWARCSHSRDAY
jgi:hypothetical protein